MTSSVAPNKCRGTSITREGPLLAMEVGQEGRQGSDFSLISIEYTFFFMNQDRICVNLYCLRMHKLCDNS